MKTTTQHKNKVLVTGGAGYIGSQSVVDPLKYYDNNINSLLSVLRLIKKYDIKNLILIVWKR